MIYLQLFLSFLQIGMFSFGGGYAAMPLIQGQVVQTHQWMTMSEFTDLITISQMTPGPIAVNAATFVGIKIAGIPGALVATLGCILPSCMIVTVLARLYLRYRKMDMLQGVLGNEQVADLMRRGVSLPDAYRAAYFDHIMQQATAQTAQKVEQGVAARIQQRASRPGENGTRPGGAVTTHVDVASMSRRQLEDLERRARRGEKITL